MAKLFLWIWCEIFDDMELVAVIGFQSNTRYAFATFGKHEVHVTATKTTLALTTAPASETILS